MDEKTKVEPQLIPYEPLCTCLFVGWSFGYNFPKGRETKIPCSYRSTCIRRSQRHSTCIIITSARNVAYLQSNRRSLQGGESIKVFFLWGEVNLHIPFFNLSLLYKQ